MKTIARVRRGGQAMEIDAETRPGDIVLVRRATGSPPTAGSTC